MSLAINFRKIAPGAGAALALAAMLAFTPIDAMAAETLKTGSFIGASDHVTTGNVTIERDGDKTYVVLGPKFSLDGAPAPTLGFAKGDAFDKSTEFSKLKQLKGRQVYELPKSIALAAYDTLMVWCSDFSIPLGKARLG